MQFSLITAADDKKLADIIRCNLKKHNLDIPGTAYYDENLNHLSYFYLEDAAKRFYYVLKDDEGNVIGGVGLAELSFFENCAELQKLYLADSVKGAGIGYQLISLIEDKARELGYKRIYLETHTNLMAAIHIYEKCGYKEIDKPAGIVHATMNRFYIKELSE
ncbi:MAG: GNAT family N-acetyltransferase [Lachnospiraceae bacterium]|nr:GNAT family N-acetyltransferase [Lachnospiraceae bacterium]